MKRLFLAIAVLCFATSATYAIPINLVTDFPVGTPLSVGAGSVSGLMTIGLTNTSPPDVSPNLLTGWNFVLDIVPLGLPGLTFNSPALGGPTPAADPPSYVLTNQRLGISTTNAGGITLTALDAEFPLLVGTSVPASGANLLQVNFLASSNFGTYNVVARTAGSSIWTGDTGLTNAFGNDPGTGFAIGQVIVTPEPSSLLVWFGFLVSAGLVSSRRRRDQAASL